MHAIRDVDALRQIVSQQVNHTKVLDIHTHIYEETFGSLLLRGPEELIRYHYLQAETNRLLSEPDPAGFMAMDKPAQERLIWQKSFVERSPISEAARGVITTWSRFGVPDLRDYDATLEYFRGMSCGEHIDRVFDLAGVSAVVMTNDPLDPAEQRVWLEGQRNDSRFLAALRIDSVLLDWSATWPKLHRLGYAVERALTEATLREIERFVVDWITRMQPVYVAASLPPTFAMPADSEDARILAQAVLPACQQFDIPFAMMIGVKKRMAPELGDAGDGVGRANLDSVSHLCRAYPHTRFLLTVLARENQHEAVVLACKFRNLHIFGCWWFNNNPSIVEEITRERIEMMGLSVTPQHSDARVLDQLVYKWTHFRKVLVEIMVDTYAALIDSGWCPTDKEIERDVAMLFGGEFLRFVNQKL